MAQTHTFPSIPTHTHVGFRSRRKHESTSDRASLGRDAGAGSIGLSPQHSAPRIAWGILTAMALSACLGENPVLEEKADPQSTGGAEAVATGGTVGDGTTPPTGVDLGTGGTGASAGADGTGGAVPAYCGNGVIDAGETCDDGNAGPGDGCSALCTTEQFFACPVPGEPCVSTIVCGDMAVQGIEACDDGNTVAGDGCSADCLGIEVGFTCPTADGIGGACDPVIENVCGDGRQTAGQLDSAAEMEA